MLNSIARDGKLYCLPCSAQVRDIVYNTILFEEKGWKVPYDFNRFIALCRTIEARGIRSIHLSFSNSELLDTAFGATATEAASAPRPMPNGWPTTKGAGAASGSISAPPSYVSNHAVQPPVRHGRGFGAHGPKGGYALTGSTDQFALMPFFSPGTPCDWDRLYMVCYIGLNKHLGEPQNKKKYDPVMQLMDYISTPEGQLALAADTGAMYSSVKKVPAPDIPEIADMLPALSHGRYAIFPESKNAQDALREGLAGMLAGALTQDDVIRMVDHQNKNPLPPKACTVIGEATADFTLIETGNFLTDAMRAKAGADVALFLDNGNDGKDNGKGVSARFRPQTTNDVSGLSPI